MLSATFKQQAKFDFRRGNAAPRFRISLRLVLIVSAVIIVFMYVAVFRALFLQDDPIATQQDGLAFMHQPTARMEGAVPKVKEASSRMQQPVDTSELKSDNEQPRQKKMQQKNGRKLATYPDWKELVMDLAAMTPTDVLRTLHDEDPFGVRTFERKLLDQESQKQAFLTHEELKELFPCPDQRITLPNQRKMDMILQFVDDPDVFLFFQHLRKAGGTNFCALAERNLPKNEVPSYYCMPDYHWKITRPHEQQRCAGCFSYWTNEEIVTNMHAKHHKILGNEWDAFESNRFFDLPAVFATSFRKPLHRALSQFRFECIEDRGCRIKVIEKWWEHRKDLANVYTWTFTDKHVRKKIQAAMDDASVQTRRDILGQALDTVAKFHLVMVMEWLAYAPDHVRKVLGFEDTHPLTERVRPHINQYQRDDGQETNKLGAAGIAKASWSPEEYLSKEQYKIMSEDLALDEILTDAARRMFLERVVCREDQ